jgi:GxxExxY protein
MERENELASLVIDLCYRIHQEYGPGLLESVYENILAHELMQGGLKVEVQKSVPLQYNNLFIPIAFRADMIIEDCLLVELKSVEELPKIAYKQLLTYLRLTEIKLGLLINFNVELIKNGMHRVVNGL